MTMTVRGRRLAPELVPTSWAAGADLCCEVSRTIYHLSVRPTGSRCCCTPHPLCVRSALCFSCTTRRLPAGCQNAGLLRDSRHLARHAAPGQHAVLHPFDRPILPSAGHSTEKSKAGGSSLRHEPWPPTFALLKPRDETALLGTPGEAWHALLLPPVPLSRVLASARRRRPLHPSDV